MNTDMNTPQRSELARSISFSRYITLGLGMIVGVGWVVYSGQWLQDGGPLGAMLAFGIGGLLLVPVGMCYAEMTAALPLAGGELAFSYKAFGKLAGFLTAWTLALGYISIMPFETIAIGSLLETLLPAIVSDAFYYVGDEDSRERVSASTILPGLIVGGYLLYVNYRGVGDSTRFQTYVVYALLACTLLFTVVALAKGNPANLEPLFAVQTGRTRTLASISASIISVLVVVPFFMAGFDAIPQAAEESGAQVPLRKLGIAILTSIVAGAGFYVLIILAVSISMPWTVSARLPMTTSAVFEAAFGYAWAAKLVLFTALLGLITTLNGLFIAAPRVLFALGRGGFIPRWFAAVHPVHHTPVNAIIFCGAIALLGPFVGKFALTPIVNGSSFLFSFAMAMTAAAAIHLRRSAPGLARPYRAPSLFLYAGLSVTILLLLLMVLPQSPGSLGSLEFIVVTTWWAAGLAAYAWRQNRHPMSERDRAHMILGEFALVTQQNT